MRLPAIQTKTGAIGLVELDQALGLASLLQLDLGLENNEQLLTELHKQLLLSLSSEATGVMLDPLYTLPLIEKKAKNTGLVLRLGQLYEETDPLAVPSLIPDWGIENIKQNYGVATIELYYHPAEKQALAKKQLLAELCDYCQYEGIHLFLNLIIYTPAEEEFSPELFQQAQMQAIEELRGSCHLIALQYPLDALSAATVTAELDIPWIVSLSAEDYSTNKEHLRASVENGAKGFMAGEILWQGLEELRAEDQSLDLNAMFRYIQTTSRDRLLELMRITKEEVGQFDQVSTANE